MINKCIPNPLKIILWKVFQCMGKLLFPSFSCVQMRGFTNDTHHFQQENHKSPQYSIPLKKHVLSHSVLKLHFHLTGTDYVLVFLSVFAG